MLESLGQGGPAGYLLVVLAAATPMVEILLVIPAGIAVGMAPFPVTALALIGNTATVALVAIFGDRLLGRVRRRRAAARGAQGATTGQAPSDRAPAGRRGRARRIVERYGVPGLALVAPILTGTHLAVLAALAVGGRRGPVLAWMTASMVGWAILTAVAAVLGLGILGIGAT